MTTESTTDERWMAEALALAIRGQGSVEPNPMVGAVVLNERGQFVGEGWHERFGGPHAEVNAFAMAGKEARGGTLFATLEPCCHHGKTPPCTDAVLKSGVRQVFVAMADPFPKVAGGGIEILRDAGIAVTLGSYEREARRLNAPYLKLVETGRPWVIAKWAMTLDGKIATATGDSKWISGEESRKKVHELRGRVDAVIVGSGTLKADDPLLTARPPGPRIATRIVVTTSGKVPERSQLLATARESPVLVATSKEGESKLNTWRAGEAEILALPSSDNGVSIDLLLAELGRRRMTNVLVEGGAGLLGAFHDAGAIDEAWVFIAPKLIGGVGPGPVAGKGVERIANALQASETTIERIGPDTWIKVLFSKPGPSR